MHRCVPACVEQVLEVPEASKEELQEAWKAWMQEAGGWLLRCAVNRSTMDILCSSGFYVAICRPWKPAPQLLLHAVCMQWRRPVPSLQATPPGKRCGSSAGGPAASVVVLGWRGMGGPFVLGRQPPPSSLVLLPAWCLLWHIPCWLPMPLLDFPCTSSLLPPPPLLASRPRAAKPEIRLTPGKGVQDLTCSVEDLVDQVVKTCKVRRREGSRREEGSVSVVLLGSKRSELAGKRSELGRRWRGRVCGGQQEEEAGGMCPAGGGWRRQQEGRGRAEEVSAVSATPLCLQVVAFVKGTRTQPQCGFSYKVLTILQEVRAGVGVKGILVSLIGTMVAAC